MKETPRQSHAKTQSGAKDLQCRGVVLVMMAGAMTILISIVMIAISLGLAYANKTRMQNLANLAVIEGANAFYRARENQETGEHKVTPSEAARQAVVSVFQQSQNTLIASAGSLYNDFVVYSGSSVSSGSGYLMFGEWLESGECTDPVTGKTLLAPCFQGKETTNSTDQVTGAKILLRTENGRSLAEPLSQFLKKVFGVELTTSVESIVRLNRRCTTLSFDISRSSTAESHEMSELIEIDSSYVPGTPGQQAPLKVRFPLLRAGTITLSGASPDRSFRRPPAGNTNSYLPNQIPTIAGSAVAVGQQYPYAGQPGLFALRGPIDCTDPAIQKYFRARFHFPTDSWQWDTSNYLPSEHYKAFEARVWCSMEPARPASGAANKHYQSDYVLVDTPRGQVYVDLYTVPEPLRTTLLAFNAGLRQMKAQKTSLDFVMMHAFNSRIIGQVPGSTTGKMTANLDFLITLTNFDRIGSKVTGASVQHPNFLDRGWFPLFDAVDLTNIAHSLDVAISTFKNSDECSGSSVKNLVIVSDGMPSYVTYEGIDFSAYAGLPAGSIPWTYPSFAGLGNDTYKQYLKTTFGLTNAQVNGVVGSQNYNSYEAYQGYLGLQHYYANSSTPLYRKTIYQKLKENNIAVSFLLVGDAVETNFDNVRAYDYTDENPRFMTIPEAIANGGRGDIWGLNDGRDFRLTWGGYYLPDHLPPSFFADPVKMSRCLGAYSAVNQVLSDGKSYIMGQEKDGSMYSWVEGFNCSSFLAGKVPSIKPWAHVRGFSSGSEANYRLRYGVSFAAPNRLALDLSALTEGTWCPLMEPYRTSYPGGAIDTSCYNQETLLYEAKGPDNKCNRTYRKIQNQSTINYFSDVGLEKGGQAARCLKDIIGYPPFSLEADY